MNNFMNSPAPQLSSIVTQAAPARGSNQELQRQFGGDAPPPADDKAIPSGELDLQQDFSRADRGSQHHPIAEFLYQLTKMLTDDNSEIIEWVDGRIKVHHPERLESEVLHKYFRHSKFASFQRQLNYFGFRKIAGKGKMSPCSYVNEAATSDIRSLLLIKRKTNGSAARKAALAQRSMPMPNGSNDLRANLSALAAGVAAGAQHPGGRLNAPVLSNAAALLSENAARAGLGQFQFPGMQQKALGGNYFGLPNDNPMSLFMSQQNIQNQQSNINDSTQLNGQAKAPTAPSLEQLHAHLAASLAGRQQNSMLNPNALGTSAALGNLAAMYGQQQQQQQQQQHTFVDDSKQINGQNKNTNTPSLEQLHAQLAASLAGRQQNSVLNSNSIGTSALNSFSTMPATAALNLGGGPSANNETPASSALNTQNGAPSSAMPATAAVNAASAASGQSNNLFESATNLKSLINEHPSLAAGLNVSAASQGLLNRLPSSNTIFPENLSSASSFGNLLASSNRISSLLSLNNLLSRDTSMADLVLQNGLQNGIQNGVQNGTPLPSTNGIGSNGISNGTGISSTGAGGAGIGSIQPGNNFGNRFS